MDEKFTENEVITLKGQVEYLAGLINSLNARVKYLENMQEYYKEYFTEKINHLKNAYTEKIKQSKT